MNKLDNYKNSSVIYTHAQFATNFFFIFFLTCINHRYWLNYLKLMFMSIYVANFEGDMTIFKDILLKIIIRAD